MLNSLTNDSVKSEFSKSKFINDMFDWSHIDDGVMEVVLDLTTSKYFDPDQVDEAVKFALDASKHCRQVYFGPAMREHNLGKTRSDINNIFGTRGLWVDLDPLDKDLPPKELKQQVKDQLESALKRLQAYHLEPSYIVSSGNGFHIYWFFQKLFFPGDDEWMAMQAALVQITGGDVQAKDVTRLLRFPGTLNLKDITEPKPVEIIGGTRIPASVWYSFFNIGLPFSKTR